MSNQKCESENDVRSQKKVKIRCPISPEMERGMTNLIKQTKKMNNLQKKGIKMGRPVPPPLTSLDS